MRLQHPGPQVRDVVVAAAAAEGLPPQAVPRINTAPGMVQREDPRLVDAEEEAPGGMTSRRVMNNLEPA